MNLASKAKNVLRGLGGSPPSPVSQSGGPETLEATISLLTTILREAFTSEQFARVPEPDLVMDSEEAVAAFVRASRPKGVLSGVYAFLLEQACKMIRPGDRVLDLGCGPASLLTSIAELNQDSNFLGVDLSDEMIAAGKQSLQDLAVGNVELRKEDMTCLSSVESGSIDVVLSSMAIHHLPDTAHLQQLFGAIERVMAPGAKVFLADFGRIKSLISVEYFVGRAIPKDEPILEHDYRASLRAAFAVDELDRAMSARLKQAIRIYSTVVSPVMVVLMTPFPKSLPGKTAGASRFVGQLPPIRRADLWQLRMFLRLGGMPSS